MEVVACCVPTIILLFHAGNIWRQLLHRSTTTIRAILKGTFALSHTASLERVASFFCIIILGGGRWGGTEVSLLLTHMRNPRDWTAFRAVGYLTHARLPSHAASVGRLSVHVPVAA